MPITLIMNRVLKASFSFAFGNPRIHSFRQQLDYIRMCFSQVVVFTWIMN